MPIRQLVKVLAILCAVANLGAIGLVGFVLSVWATLIVGESAPEDEAEWLIPIAIAVAIVLAAPAVGLMLCVVFSRPRGAAVALSVQTALALCILGFLLEGSDNSDGRLIGFAVGVELAAGLAVWLSRQHVAVAEHTT